MRIKKRKAADDDMLSYGRYTNIGYYFSTPAIQAEIKRLLDAYKDFITPGPVTWIQPGFEAIIFDDYREFDKFLNMLFYERGKQKWEEDLIAQMGNTFLEVTTEEERDAQYKEWLKGKRKKKWKVVKEEKLSEDELQELALQKLLKETSK